MRKFSIKLLLLFSATLLALGGFALSACSEPSHKTDNSAHEHQFGSWTVVTEAKCEEAGSRYHVCSVCGYREDDVIPYLGHNYDRGEVTVEATCSTPGKRVRKCTRCQKEKEETIEKLNHNWDEGVIVEPSTCIKAGTLRLTCSVCKTTEDRELFLAPHKLQEDLARRQEATCEEDGKRVLICSEPGCPYEQTETIRASGHMWTQAAGDTEPTCTAPGTHNRECSVCGTKDETTVPALGHDLPAEYTIDKLPSFTEAGSKSYHCRRCEEHVDPVEIPMLQENVPVTFRFEVLRNNGNKIVDSNIVITVFDKGAEVAKSDASTLVNGVFTVPLDPGTAASPKTYTAKVTGLPRGYSAKEEYTVSPADPNCSIWLTAAPLQGTPSRTERYTEGSVMYDFTLPAKDNNTGKDITLSELLKTKKAVVLNFFYTTCGPCQREFPYLMQAYTKYKDSIAVIAIDETRIDSMVAVTQFAIEYGLVFPVAFSTSFGIQSAFGFTDVPQTVVIDGEGVVSVIHSGTSTFDDFDKLFAPYASDSYWKNPEKKTTAAISAAQPLPLPLRKRETY